MNYSRYVYYATLLKALIHAIDWMYPSVLRKTWRQYLGEIRQEIQTQRERIHAKQTGSAWQVTSGDKVFIKYLDAAEAIVSSMLEKIWLTRGAVRDAKAQLAELLPALETDHHPKIKVVFFAQETNIWPSFESVYRAFAADPRCETRLIYVPFEHQNTDRQVDWFAIYQSMDLPIQHCRDYDLSAEAPDIVFFAKPYDGIPLQFYIKNVDPVVERSIYIPYWVNWMAIQNIQFLIDYHYRLLLFEKAWKIFDAPDYVLESHVQYGPQHGENVELLGHPRFDSLKTLMQRRESIPSTWKEKIAGKRVILWNTHSYIARENWSTYGRLGREMLEYFQASEQFVLLWRPHPFFFNSLINGGVMTPDEAETLVSLASNSSHIIFDKTPDYLSAFSIADALISDASSLLVEFLPTGNPILYTYNEASYSIVNENLLPALYTASSWSEVKDFLQMLAESKDHKQGERRSVVKKFMPNIDRNVGELIKDKCIDDLVAEETSAGKAITEGYKKRLSRA